MRLVRLLLYTLATLAGLYVLAAVLYAIPVISGLLSRLAAEMHAALEPRVEARSKKLRPCAKLSGVQPFQGGGIIQEPQGATIPS